MKTPIDRDKEREVLNFHGQFRGNEDLNYKSVLRRTFKSSYILHWYKLNLMDA